MYGNFIWRLFADKLFEILEELLKTVNDLLSIYHGTKPYHNFTSGKTKGSFIFVQNNSLSIEAGAIEFRKSLVISQRKKYFSVFDRYCLLSIAYATISNPFERSRLNLNAQGIHKNLSIHRKICQSKCENISVMSECNIDKYFTLGNIF